MPDTLTAEQYRTIMGGPSHKAIKKGAPLLLPKESEESRIRHHLRSMAHYFDIPEKEAKYYIRQLELSGKI